MATAKRQAKSKRPLWLKLVLVLLLLALAVAAYARMTLAEQARLATAYGAHLACSCSHIGGRALDQCTHDFEPGMEAVFLTEDHEAKSVTATIPLVASATATYREGYGCVLEPWRG